MVNHLKFLKEHGEKLFFYSDLHYNHELLMKNRGFNDVFSYNKALVDGWNKGVDNDSTVFYLGDLILGAKERGEEFFDYLIKNLNYKELYVASGNHFSGLRQKFNSLIEENVRIDRLYRLAWNPTPDKIVYFIPNYYEILIGKTLVVMSHYPILSYNGMNRDSVFIFGHSHNNLTKNPWVKDNYLNGRVLDVGPESIGFAPISFDRVMGIMASRVGKVFDHH